MALIAILLSLAIWRIAVMLVHEHGFLGFAKKLRLMFGVLEGDPPEDQINAIAGILSCVWCCSMWVSIFATPLSLVLINYTTWGAYPIWIFGCAAPALFYDALLGRLQALPLIEGEADEETIRSSIDD
jgi:hypothetical protein